MARVNQFGTQPKKKATAKPQPTASGEGSTHTGQHPHKPANRPKRKR